MPRSTARAVLLLGVCLCTPALAGPARADTGAPGLDGSYPVRCVTQTVPGHPPVQACVYWPF